MTLKRLLQLLAVLLLIGAGATVLFYYSIYFYRLEVVDTNVKVHHGVAGLNVDTDKLWMGTLSPGGRSVREVIVRVDRPSRVTVRFTGPAAPYFFATPNTFELDPGENVTVTLTAAIPPGTPEGSYDGEAHFAYYRRWF